MGRVIITPAACYVYLFRNCEDLTFVFVWNLFAECDEKHAIEVFHLTDLGVLGQLPVPREGTRRDTPVDVFIVIHVDLISIYVQHVTFNCYFDLIARPPSQGNLKLLLVVVELNDVVGWVVRACSVSKRIEAFKHVFQSDTHWGVFLPAYDVIQGVSPKSEKWRWTG